MTTYIATLAASNEVVDQNTAADLRERFGLDQPMIVQYWKWISASSSAAISACRFEWQQPVGDLIWERMALTLVLTFATLLATWAHRAADRRLLGRARSIRSATTSSTFLSFLGLAIPSFLLALVLMYVAAVEFGQEVGGLFSEQYVTAPWSIGKVARPAAASVDPGDHPGGVRHGEPDPRHARQHARRARQALCHHRARQGPLRVPLLVKYPVRLALNPFISTIAWLLPNLVSGSIIVAIVLSLPTAGPLLLQSLMSQDMYLAGAFVLLICALTLVGSLISDILLALVDPRIRLE